MIMSQIDIDKFYVSPVDKFLEKFDAEHVLTESQKREIEKHQRIAKARDVAKPESAKSQIWSDF